MRAAYVLSSEKMKRILIIGCNGFIGSACAEYFRVTGHEVYGADITPAKNIAFFLLDPKRPDFDALFRQFKPTVCINASGAAIVALSIERPEEDHRLNVENVQLMLEAITHNNPQIRFLNFSSAAVYGNPSSLPINENAGLKPLSPYGKHKLECEQLLSDYTIRGLHTCSLRIFSAYGPGLRKQLFWDLFQKAKTGPVINLFGTGDESRDFIFIEDLVRAVAVIAERGEFKGESINVASGTETTIRKAADIFLGLLGQGFVLQFSGEEKTGDPRNWKADISRLKSLGFSPTVSIREGLEKTVHGYQATK